MSLGLPTSVLTPFNEGLLRFPSGAVVAYDCEGAAGPVIVAEPDWIRVSRQEDSVVLQVNDAGWLPPDPAVSLVTRDERGGFVEAQRLGRTSSSWTFQLMEGHSHAMVRINGVWVGRWFRVDEGL